MFGQHAFETTETLFTDVPTAVAACSSELGPETDASTLVANLDLSAVALRLMTAPDGPKWNEEEVAAAELRYRRFLLMTKLHPHTPFTPARDIDTVWHEHILNTRAYWSDCQSLFGEYLHHDAGYGSEEKDFEDKAVLDDATAKVYTDLFGEPYFSSAAATAYCTISACVEAVSAQPSAGKAAYCTISACVEAVSAQPVPSKAAYCTISACVEVVSAQPVPSKTSPQRKAAYCTISACVEAVSAQPASSGTPSEGKAAYCTISACVEAKGGLSSRTS